MPIDTANASAIYEQWAQTPINSTNPICYIGGTGEIATTFRVIYGNFNEDKKTTINLESKVALNSAISKISSIGISKEWQDEGVEAPNAVCKEYAIKVCNTLYEKAEIAPLAASPSVENGIFLTYKNQKGIDLYVEVYNDLEIAAVINDAANKNILFSEDIKNFDFENVIAKFTI